MNCNKCKKEILSRDDLVFYHMNDTSSIHLIVKHEELIIASNKRLLISDSKIFCPHCKTKIGSQKPLGPHSSMVLLFLHETVSLCGKATKRKWHEVCNEPPYNTVCSRNYDTFFGHSMTSEEDSSPKRPRLDEAETETPIVFPDPQELSEFSFEDILMSDRAPYDYQITSYIEALQRDLIVVLPTGYGKTLIASLVAAKMKQLNDDYMILFIVDRIPLVFQQGEAISFDTHLRVCPLTSENHNFQKQKQLMKGEFDVLVSTAGAYKSLRGKLDMSKFCYVIIDECHHATGRHDYVDILEFVHQCENRPRVLGLTASPPNRKSESKTKSIISEFKSHFFDAPICHNLNLESQERGDAKIKIETVPQDPPSLEERKGILKEEMKKRIDAINANYENEIIICRDLSLSRNRAEMSRILSLHQLKYNSNKDIGYLYKELVRIYEVLVNNELLGATYADDVLDDLEFYEGLKHQQIQSARMITLLGILNELGEDSKIIIFVQTRKIARVLSTILKENCEIEKNFFPRKMVGQGGTLGMSWEDEQEETLRRFSQGDCNLIISTSVLEEGLDVPSCNVVIRFDGVKTLTSFKQSRGRARKWENSQFILLLSEKEKTQYDERCQEELLVEKVLRANFTDTNIPSDTTTRVQKELESQLLIRPPSEFAARSSECAVEFYLSGTHELYDVQGDIANSLMDEIFLSLRHIDLADPDSRWKSRGIFPAEDSLLILGLAVQNQSRSIYERYKQLTVQWRFSLKGISQNVWTRTEIPQTEESKLERKLTCKWPVKKIVLGKFVNKCTFSPSEIVEFAGKETCIELVSECNLLIRYSSGIDIVIPLATFHRFILADWRKKNVRLYILLRNPPEIRTTEQGRVTSDTCPTLSYFGDNPVLKITIPYDRSNWSQLWVFLHTSNVFPVPLFETRVRKDDIPTMETDENLVESANSWTKPMQDCMWLFSILKSNRNVCLPMGIINRITSELYQAQNNIKDLSNLKHALTHLLILVSNVRTHYFVDLEAAFTEELQHIRSNPPICLGCQKNYCYIECAMVTPSRIIPLHPILNQCNRLYRKYPDERFLNMAFRDEDEGNMDRREQMLERVKNILEHGISISGAKFYFLVCSSSQLRSKRAIFIQLRDSDPVQIQIRLKDMRFQLIGKCEINNETKFLSRLGLFCTSDHPTCEIEERETACLPDLKAKNGLLLTDGAGKIKKSLAARVFERIATKETLSRTSALQIRLAGLKGVFTIVDDDTDPNFSNNQHCTILYRSSMKKIEWTHSTLCIVKLGKFNKLYLNVQMLNLLTSLEDSDKSWDPKPRIKALYSDTLYQFARIFIDKELAKRELESNLPDYFQHTDALQTFNILCEPFFLKLLRCIYSQNIKNLIEKVHIPIPITYGCILMGTPDPIGVLNEGEVFITFQNVNHEKETIKEGRLLIYKNPCLHPGDLLTPTAVDRPELHHLHNVIVFPITGSTSLPASTGGGDLDGDEFAIIWDPDLIPPETATHDPLNYDKIAEPYKNKLGEKSDDELFLQDDPLIQHRLTEGYCRVIANDLLGIISHYHLAISDQKPHGARDLLCIQLAEQASLAVDSPKTGITPEIPQEAKTLILNEGYPDFMEKRDKTSYRSTKLLGDLYHQAREVSYQKSEWVNILNFTGDYNLKQNTQDNLLLSLFKIPGYDIHMEDALLRYYEFSSAFQQIMLAFGIETEAEVVTSLIINCHPLLTADKGKTKNCLEAAFHHLTQQYREIFRRDTPSTEYQKKAAAWYLTAYQRTPRNSEDIIFHSFAWLVPEYLCDILSQQQNIFPIEPRNQVLSNLGDTGRKYVMGQSEFIRTFVESKQCVFPTIESAINRYSSLEHPSEENAKMFDVVVFGSTSVFLCELQSDLDLSIELTEFGKSVLSNKVGFNELSFKEQQQHILNTYISPVIYKIAVKQTDKLGVRVPVISFTIDPKNKKQFEVSVDITVESNGVPKSQYIRQFYQKAGGTFFAWMWLLVHWARHVGILKCYNSLDCNGIILTAEFEAFVLYIYDKMINKPEISCDENVDCSLDTLLDLMVIRNSDQMLGVMLEEFFWLGYTITSNWKSGDTLVYTWPIRPIKGDATHTITDVSLEKISTLLFQGWQCLMFTRDVNKLFERAQTRFSINKRFSHRLSSKIRMSAEFYRKSLSESSGASIKLQNSGGNILLTGYGNAAVLLKLSAELSSLEADKSLIKRYRSNANRYMIEGCVAVVTANTSQDCRIKLGAFEHGCYKHTHVNRTISSAICADQEMNENWEVEGITRIKSLLYHQLARLPVSKTELLDTLKLKTRFGYFYVMDGVETFRTCGNSLHSDEFQKCLVKNLKYRRDISNIENFSPAPTNKQIPTPSKKKNEIKKKPKLKSKDRSSCIYTAFCPGMKLIDDLEQAKKVASEFENAILPCGFQRIQKNKSYTWRVEIQPSLLCDVRFNLDENLNIISITDRPIIWLLATILGDRRIDCTDKVHDLRIRAETAKLLNQDSKICQFIFEKQGSEPSLITIKDGIPIPCEGIKNHIKFIKHNIEAAYYLHQHALAKISCGVEYCKESLDVGRYYCELNLYHDSSELIEIVASGNSWRRIQELADKALKLTLSVSKNL